MAAFHPGAPLLLTFDYGSTRFFHDRQRAGVFYPGTKQYPGCRRSWPRPHAILAIRGGAPPSTLQITKNNNKSLTVPANTCRMRGHRNTLFLSVERYGINWF